MSQGTETSSQATAVRPRVSIKGLEIMDISLVREVHQQLLNAVREGASVEIDASGIRRVDTAMMQLFAVFAQEARAAGLEVRWHAPSAALLEAADLLALRDLLKLPPS
jgi:ABC-type transporter Mla MlaB component